MIRRLLMIAFAMLCYHPLTQAGVFDDWIAALWKTEKPLPPTIKVLVVHDKPGVVLEVKGKYKIYDPHQNAYISTRFIGKRKFIQAISDGLKWGEEFPGIHQIKIVPDDTNTTTLVDGIEYKGSVYVYDIGGTISVVNEIDIEDYLKSLLEPQFDDNLLPETFAAIAIAARTNAYYLAMHPRSNFWSIDAKSVDYDGHALAKKATGIEKAIAATRYMVMTLPENGSTKGETFPALWSINGNAPKEKGVAAQISLYQAEEMAKGSDHAAQILAKAFPGSQIVLMHTTSGS